MTNLTTELLPFTYSNLPTKPQIEWATPMTADPIFLTLSNRPFVRMEGAVIVNTTPEEWQMITNAYSKRVVTNEWLKFYGYTNRTKPNP